MHVRRSALVLIASGSFGLLMAQYGLDREMALGRQMASEVRRRTRAIDDARIEGYVTDLARGISGAMPEARVPFTFSVIAEDPCASTHEPGSLPGGYVFVPAALFLEARSEAEFAGMLAHSMAHVAVRQGARPVTRPVTQGRFASGESIPLIFIGGWNGHCWDGVVPIGLRETQRNDEMDADSLAITMMARAGFDPAAFVRYIQRVSLPPDRGERVAAMSAVIARLPAASYGQTRGEFADIQQRIRSK